MTFVVLPPEINSGRMFAGAGSGPMLAAAAAWDGLASELGSAAASFKSVTSGLVQGAWQGAAATAMAGAAAPYAGWLSAADCAGRGGGRSRQSGGRGVRGGAVGDGAPGVGGGQPVYLGVAGAVKSLGAQCPRDRRRRGPIRTDVGPRCGRDVRLSQRGVGGGRQALAAQFVEPAGTQRASTWASATSGSPTWQRQHRQLQLRQRQQRAQLRPAAATATWAPATTAPSTSAPATVTRPWTAAGLQYPRRVQLQRGLRQHRPTQHRSQQRRHRQHRLQQRKPGRLPPPAPRPCTTWASTTVGTYNRGVGNVGNHNVGFANVGNNDIGIGLNGDNEIGIGGLNANGAHGNFGLGNNGSYNIGFGQQRQLQHRLRQQRQQ